MNFDFATILAIATLVTGLIWAFDAWKLAPKRRAEAERLGVTADFAEDTPAAKALKEPVIVEYAKSFFPVILAVLLLRGFLVEPFRIPSGSMIPTLLVGDFILVNKYAYGLRLPVTNTKILDIGLPQRGDVVVFRFPRDPSIDYIKRVIGLPGDVITYHNKTIFVNGNPISYDRIGQYRSDATGLPVPQADEYLEHLNDVNHRILLDDTRPSMEVQVRVPEGQYFMMGDNRDNSNDSRYWGTVPEENLVGRAFLIWMNWDVGKGGVLWRRIGDTIK
ncbi:MAG: signal peptidase I [Gammaproteobacteria bacterium]|nr:signal peptidase I [Gammaproteobacteria bacterium]